MCQVLPCDVPDPQCHPSKNQPKTIGPMIATASLIFEAIGDKATSLPLVAMDVSLCSEAASLKFLWHLLADSHFPEITGCKDAPRQALHRRMMRCSRGAFLVSSALGQARWKMPRNLISGRCCMSVAANYDRPGAGRGLCDTRSLDIQIFSIFSIIQRPAMPWCNAEEFQKL
jgi:hypothetical protein